MKELPMEQEQTQHKAHLSRKESREIVTPYAFHVSPDLFGLGLASPLRRGWAILIDIILIGLLTQVSSFILAIVAAATFFVAGNRLKQKKRYNAGRIFLRFLAAILLFVFALGVFESLNDDLSHAQDDFITLGNESNEGNQLKINSVAGVALTAKYLIKTSQLTKHIEEGECSERYACWQGLGEELSADLIELELPEDDSLDILEVFSEASEQSLDQAGYSRLQGYLKQQYLQDPLQAKNLRDTSQQQIPNPISAIGQNLDAAPAIEKEVIDRLIEPPENNQNSSSNKPGLIPWLTGLAEDLGLGFGWAAFYFSIFTAWWKGQTPGKRLLGLKVLKLDGSGLNLWESFGRYGGYGAGLATGLLGFLQIYWDPNRQAIQDKISETLVIDLAKEKVHFEPNPDLRH